MKYDEQVRVRIGNNNPLNESNISMVESIMVDRVLILHGSGKLTCGSNTIHEMGYLII